MGQKACKCIDPQSKPETMPGTAGFAEAYPVIEPKPMSLGFVTPEGESKKVQFTSRPLGLDFNMRAPIIINGVDQGSSGDQLGVKAGWKLTSVNGQDVTKVDFQKVYDMLSSYSRQLPQTLKKPQDYQVDELAMGA
eukprot:gnl/TRDRNA2_/TRDRNA2_191275_c0_seq1.p1 gnl/TRDRNA2_/TRDRNA2_191275_c0~~gnl/TRDRNA2_/TRDRNA2_191275_c0_seq1.p1  ORF type:complete len:136 (-),score=13.01 gnl/TRDRNA2_/TRDRNA2_191275_c0_seq1:65-472(-)